MHTISLSPELLQSLEKLIKQAQYALPAVPEPPDFSAPALVWQQQQLHAVHSPTTIHLDDLIGIDRQKKLIRQNTQQFLANLPANNVLLTGARGTGKSSLVRALLTDFAEEGLRVIEVARDDLVDLPKIRQLIQGRSEKFIVYCDDLSFGAEDHSYRALKSALDGSMQSGGDNLLIYATSNRRHLLPEFTHENDHAATAQEIHPQEAVEEKVSLSDRFGLWLSFYAMDQATYLEIVADGLRKAKLPWTDLARTEALRWAGTRGQRSGRSAAQFVRHWVGMQCLQARQQGD
ncbi:MAG: ATP-binding protein [Pseudomonadota bacterium]|nr:ATP-binding protein [Pseudomonadota bacterium]